METCEHTVVGAEEGGGPLNQVMGGGTARKIKSTTSEIPEGRL